ncbi:hypothetical protein ASPCAL14351 [Aspergillus calidoustus]|uniref:Reverse transcriptase domain-containing protein n=1 Tax=Aspergillus calidoustus TaxID=454130 RepID=A0A0U5GHT3_ASPCI|nr:hypothetical protein ASPCAL14351 [Aspergillus calidoustus]
MVGAPAFHQIAKKKGTTVFIASLYEINKILEERRAAEASILVSQVGEPEPSEEEIIKRTLLKEYHDLWDVFSKRESDQMPPSRPNDYRIELEGDNNIGYGPLYRMSTEELEAARQYILDNLDKGFIEACNSPFASPILMAQKPGGGLRFCVDYRKLNAITKKDRYPLPLIDEVLERISQAKIFTKLDIRQGFHRLRMHPDSEDLTAFRSRYGTYKYKVLPFGLTNGPAAF